MNKLSQKFIFGISAILLITIAASLFINSYVIERYYSHEKKKSLDNICTQLEQAVKGEDTQEKKEDMISAIEGAEEVTIVWLHNTNNLNELNEELQSALRDKGIGFQKFWLWEQDYQSAMKNGRQMRIYNQGKLNYSLMVEYMEHNTDFYAVAMIIPHMSDAIKIVNTATFSIIIFALFVAVVLVVILIKRITKPLDSLKQFADDIAMHKFHQIEIHTHDELETVAASMNQMCIEIQKYQNELLDKNKQMEQLLNNVAHDLKTPVALIRAYAGGIKDNLDDGTFLDIIIRQNDRMSSLIENLLFLSRLKKRELIVTEIALDELLYQLLEEQSILLDKNEISFQTNISSQSVIQSNEEIVMLIFNNLLSNALKYSSRTIIEISLQGTQNGYLFEITNQTNRQLNPELLWEPFYVGEPSRNKELSGTGLGLTMVKNSAEEIGAVVDCYITNKKITFQVLFQNMK